MAKSSSLGRSLLKAQAKRNIRNKGVELGGKKENFVSENNQSNIKSCVLLNCPVEELMFIKEFTGNSYLKAKNEETVIERPIQHINELGDKFCPIFKRPAWTRDMTCEQVNHNEKEAFLEYKRNLYNLQSSKNKAITPFEKNIEIWRQLWRVIEYSDLICQIVDARNPLFFYSKDITEYVKEVETKKTCLLLINKADLLTNEQIIIWKEYFKTQGIDSFFFSSLMIEQDKNNTESITTDRCRLIELFHHYRTKMKLTKINVGFIGFPNVGKSSTINNLVGMKKTAVSFTPGKTKHLQTLYLDESTVLYDCPGLVLPQFINSKEELVINGILPIDQINDITSSIDLIVQIIPRIYFEQFYSTTIPSCSDNLLEYCNQEQLLTSIAFLKGFLGPKNVPDFSKVAKTILKDLTSGRFTYCHPPPVIDSYSFNKFDSIEIKTKPNKILEHKIVSYYSNKSTKNLIDQVDRNFLLKETPNIHIVNSNNMWENLKRHKLRKGPKKPKKEKLRRVYKNDY